MNLWNVINKLSFCIIFYIPIYANGNYNYIHYHRLIIQAESNILDSNYTEAVNIYKIAFNKYNYVFVQNIFTAVQTAIVTNSYNDAFSFLEKGIKFGFDVREIYKDSLLIKLIKCNYWNIFISKYDSLRNIYLKNINHNLQKQVIKFYNEDMQYRNLCEEYPRNALLLPINRLRWKKATTKLVEKIISIIEQQGYLGQKLVGIIPDSICTNYTEYNAVSSVTNDKLRTVMIHYYSFKRKIYHTISKKEIEEGNLLPRDFAMFNSYISNYVNSKQNNIYGQGLQSNIDTLQANKERLEIGLETLQELDKKRKRGLKICEELNKGNYFHIKLWYWCG